MNPCAKICVNVDVVGFNVETVEYKNISFTVWDVGGQDKVCIFSSFAWRGHGI